MTGPWLALFAAVPLGAGGLLVFVPGRPRFAAATLIGTMSVALIAALALVVELRDGGVIAHAIGGWPFGIAIPFVVDMFSALMLTVTSVLTLACSAFAIASGTARRRFFPALVLVLTAGVNGALLTADMFNLFVFIEVMLLPSYGLLILSASGRGPIRRLRGARLYVTVNLLTSTIFLAGVALIYGTTGTVNLAELAGAATESTTVAVAAAVCLFALSIKAAVVPVHGWLTRTYAATSPAVTALFSGLHTKVAIYAIYRVYAVIFEGNPAYLWVGVLMFSVTMVVGVLGAVGESTTRSILAFHMVSQIGYILLGVALFGPVGLTAGIFYLLHHMIVKASLFLSTGAIEVRYGTGTLGRLGGLARREPWVAVAFFAAALSLAGLPPFSGFVAKLSLIMAAWGAGQYAAAVTAVAVSLITLLSMLKIWSGVFWGRDPESEERPGGDRARQPGGSAATGTSADDRVVLSGNGLSAAGPSGAAKDVGAVAVIDEDEVTPAGARAGEPRRRVGLALIAPALALAVVTLVLGLGGQILLDVAETAAGGLIDTTAYVEAVRSP